MTKEDAYLNYIQSFFTRWVALYDWFAYSIFYVYAALINAIKPSPGMKILDLCTGTGEIALRAAALGAQVTGVDITEAMLLKAERKATNRNLHIDFNRMDARYLTYPNASFDVVVLSFALHDMPRPVRVEVLKEAARVSKGPVFVTDYELPATPILFRFWLWTISLFESPYFPHFAKEKPESIFSEAGLLLVGKQRLFPAVFSIYELKPRP